MKSLENLGVQALSAHFMLAKACGESQTAWGEMPKCRASSVGAGIYSLSLSLSFVSFAYFVALSFI